MSARRAAYSALWYLLLPAVLLRLWWRGRKEPRYRAHIGERLGRYRLRIDANPVWIHAVSLGETRAAQPIVEQLLARYPDRHILLTHMTPTGRAAGEQLYGERVARCYLPYDLPGAIGRFLDHFQPDFGLVLETEVWPNTVAACRQRAIPLYLVNARLSEKSYRGYQRVARLAREAMGGFGGIAAQAAADAERFKALGAAPVCVMGNIKFDFAPDPELASLGRQWRLAWAPERPVFLAASTREGEEALLLDVLDAFHVPNLLTLIVPRHPQRFDEVATLLTSRRMGFVRRSSGMSPGADVRVVLGDSLGEMDAYYAACDVAFVGGSLAPLGAHNLVEACAAGKPVLIGPSVFNFEEATALGVGAGAVIQVPDAAALAREAGRLLADRNRAAAIGAAGLRFAAENQGAVQRLFAFLVEKNALPRACGPSARATE
jgi:3-deoxy-D-manno-octulosonic-acid transferase